MELGATGLCPTEASFVRYAAGKQYGLHGDAAGMDGGREWTVLVCLRAAEEGGETAFPALDAPNTYRLLPGQALVWPNYDAHGRENQAMDHAALPVVANVWLTPSD